MPARLLLADDSVTIQRVIELTFADEDIQVLAVGDGRAAIEQIQRERPDIVLADVGMPERDGYEVAAFVKESPDLAGIPVLLLTGAFEPVDEARARAVGCDGVLVKPFEPQMVISRVKDLLAGRRPEGLWAAPSAQSPVRSAAALSDSGTKSGSMAPAQGAALEDYFDRLDAAFASLETGAVAPSSPAPRTSMPQEATAPSGEFAEDLAGLLRDAPRQPAASHPVPVGQAELPTAPALITSEYSSEEPAVDRSAPSTRIEVPPNMGPTLGEAFAALLAAEQGQPFAPAAGAESRVAVSDEAVEAIVRRVVAEMTGQTVRDTVLDVAERLVREEIARIKAAH